MDVERVNDCFLVSERMKILRPKQLVGLKARKSCVNRCSKMKESEERRSMPQ